MTRPEPLTPSALADRLAGLLAGLRPDPGAAALRVAVDGPEPAGPDALADAIAARLPALGRPAVVVPASGFYRPASLRLEHGRTDPMARYTDWLDVGALAREVLNPVGPGGSATYLPVLWDLERDRAARARPQPMPADGVLLVPGALLQGVGLAFDVVVHLRVGPAARRRLTAPEQAWELPAFDRYDDEVDPVVLADAVVLADHPDRPALVLAGRFS
ncbi:uridine kinase [Blastococcus sp. CT_GayMR16]|nr:uridine kinase [Blastococcus sp. CT_GayMR16]